VGNSAGRSEGAGGSTATSRLPKAQTSPRPPKVRQRDDTGDTAGNPAGTSGPTCFGIRSLVWLEMIAPRTRRLNPPRASANLPPVNSAILVAAGKGTRMGAGVDKLFLEIAGRPVVAHTWQRFADAACVDEIVLVVRDGTQSAFAELAAKFNLRKPHRIVAGGPERQDSVWNGLQALSPRAEIVAIQDAARPCTTEALIAATIAAARETGAAVAARPVTDTIKESADGQTVLRTVDRSRLWAVQTPQTFRVEVIRRALAEVRRRQLSVTDDTAACEWIGQPVRLVVGAAPNPKVTVPGDVPYVELLLRGGGA
jgi:2-C-methyl-D-erythritol 4-phosphate cytidylyltransferase